MHNLNNFKIELQNIIEFLKKDLSSLQTGRATPIVLEGIMIESYGSMMPLIHVGAINIEDSKTLFITIYDKNQISMVEKSINDANLGLSVSSQSGGVRVVFPALTGERRLQYVKLAKERLEDARIRVRSNREETKKNIEKESKDGLFGKDEEKRLLADMQDLVDETNNSLEILFKEKEFSIMND